jgi:hypothetical protein
MAAVVAMLVAAAAQAQQVKPRCVRDTRRCMILAATSYLDGLVTHDGSKVLFAPDIVRTEQGRVNGQGEVMLRAGLDREPPMLGYTNTRYVVDERRHQLVYFTLLRLAHDARKGAAPSAAPVTVHLAERFKVEHGLITEIEALFHTEEGSADGTSGWPDAPG